MNLLLIIDIDNTLADNLHREHLLPDWKTFFQACDQDTPIVPVLEAVQACIQNDCVTPVFVTVRTKYEGVEEKTIDWLTRHGFENIPVILRPVNDFTKAHIFKSKVLEHLNHSGDVMILDDDIRIIDHFKQMGHHSILVEPENGYQKTALEIKMQVQQWIQKNINNHSTKTKKRGIL